MYQDTIEKFALIAREKATFLHQKPVGFIIGALMAGAYVGIGIILILSVGAALDPTWQKLVMGA